MKIVLHTPKARSSSAVLRTLLNGFTAGDSLQAAMLCLAPGSWKGRG